LLHLLTTAFGTECAYRHVRVEGESWRVSGLAADIGNSSLMTDFGLLTVLVIPPAD